MFLKPVIAAPNLARRNLLSEPSSQAQKSPSKLNALFRAVLLGSDACPNSGSRKVSVWYDEPLKASSRLQGRDQSPDEKECEGKFIHVFDDRRYSKGPNVLRLGAKDVTHVSELSGDRTQNGTHFDISS